MKRKRKDVLPPDPPVGIHVPRGKKSFPKTTTVVAGGLSSLLLERFRTPFLEASEEASRVLGALLYAASRLILVYVTHHIENELPFPDTGLLNENKKWMAAGGAGEAPIVVTQELCDWALTLFSKRQNASSRDSHPAFVVLKQFAEDPDGLGLFPRQDTDNLRIPIHSAARDLAVVAKNHLTIACLAHSAKALRAKYAHLLISAKEGKTLAQYIGKSAQWNSERDTLMGRPFAKLPQPRAAGRRRVAGEWTEVPAVTANQWLEIATHERSLLPATWDQPDMLRARLAMIHEVTFYNAAHKGQYNFPTFSILPLCSTGRAFVRLNTIGLRQLCTRAGIGGVEGDGVLGIFDAARLRCLLRGPQADPPRLQLRNEFFRTDGVQAHFVLGIPGVDDHLSDGDDSDDEDGGCGCTVDVDDDDEDDDEGEGAVPPGAALQVRASNQTAVDPGRTCLITMVGVSNGADVDNGADPSFKRVYRLTRREYYERRGSTKAQHAAQRYAKKHANYAAALKQLSQNSLKVNGISTIKQRLRAHAELWHILHEYSGSKSVARSRFDRMMRRGRVDAQVLRAVFPSDAPGRVIAWGSARWAVGAKGSAPCPAAALYKMLNQNCGKRGGQIILERETNTSCKCSRCLALPKMNHPVHANRKVWRDGARIVAAGEVYGLYHCSGCHRTHDRDVNGASNIWRAYYERSRGRERPPTLLSRREFAIWHASNHGNAFEDQP